MKRAEQQLREALSLHEATLESTADGILVVDREGRITSYNRRFAEMLKVPEEILAAGDDDRAIDYEAGQLKDPETFRREVEELYETPAADSISIIEFKDGRVLERSSRPQWLDGECVGRVWSYRDITEQRRLEEQLAYRADHDELTGLPNRGLFREHLEVALARAARQRRMVAVLYIDLDRFKLVNDSLGHVAGDAVLVQVARRLRDQIRAEDLAARHSGDEFLLLMADLDPRQARHPAEVAAARVHAALRRPFRAQAQELSIDASIGIALYPADAADRDGMLRHADMAMYASKRESQGGTRFGAAEGREADPELSLSGRLQMALGRGEFELHYQPVVEIGSHGAPPSSPATAVAAEALVRWRDPERGLLAAGSFVPLAEELGMMAPISDWIVQDALRQAREWRDLGIELTLSLNVSADQLRPELVSSLQKQIDAAGVDPSSVMLEMTESAAMANPRLTRDAAAELRRRGVRFALDDFGAGHSSLGRLIELQMPFDVVKFDRSFVRQVGSTTADTVLAAMMRMVRELGITSVGEGIETGAQWRFLSEHGCELGQGHIVSPPVPAAEIPALVVS